MMNRSFDRWIAVVVILLLAFAARQATAGPIVESGNLLVNPGAETGMIDPWEHVTFSVTDQPASLPAGTIDATEGDWWFSNEVDIEFTDDPPVDVIIFPTGINQDPVDVRALPPIQSITVGADAFGVWEVLAGDPLLVRLDVLLTIQLFDDDRNQINEGTVGGSLFTGFLMEANPDQELAFRQTLDVPEGVGIIRFLANFNPRVEGSAGDHVRLKYGFDELHLSVTYEIPEPTGLELVTLGTLLLFFGPARRGIRARMDSAWTPVQQSGRRS